MEPLIAKLERSVNNSKPAGRTLTFPFIRHRTDGRFAYKVVTKRRECGNVGGFCLKITLRKSGVADVRAAVSGRIETR